jgi:tRNA A37 methylthiotransferase MiaB
LILFVGEEYIYLSSIHTEGCVHGCSFCINRIARKTKMYSVLKYRRNEKKRERESIAHSKLFIYLF